ncbi:hypothetical protein HMPREF2861_11360 [Lactobacillus sp. HMSC068F07]|nr:hypothetical protein HMPREF2861_11360 [Lactobacillus sp. HMSC068F07]
MHNWLKQRAPWQIGLLVVGCWLVLSLTFVTLLISMTPTGGITGGPFVPSVYRAANGDVTVTWLADVWIFAIVCGYLTGRQYRKRQQSRRLIRTLMPLLFMWVILIALTQWHPLATQTFPNSTAGFFLVVMLSFLCIFPAGIMSAYIGLFRKGSRWIWAVFFIFLMQMQRPYLWIVNGKSHVGMTLMHGDPVKWKAWILTVLGLIFVAFFAFMSTDPEIVKKEF